MSEQKNGTPFVLCILDGWGIAEPSRGNALTSANTPFFDELYRSYLSFSVAASGEAVGLSWGEPGNSEVGHMNIGAGKIVYQEVLRINKAIENETFFDNEAFAGAVMHAKKHNSCLHVVGILSEGGVHGHQDHVYAVLEFAARMGLKKVCVHPILDGRDTAFNSGLQYIKQLKKVLKRLQIGRIASISGRFYAMDRDNHWERIEQTYQAMVRGESEFVEADAEEAVRKSYARTVYDEEFVPTVIRAQGDEAYGAIRSGDSVVITNYRPDRARELAKVFSLPTFTKFERGDMGNMYVATMVRYESDLPVHVAYTKDTVDITLSRVISDAGLRQLHIAETEKYAHVTYFLNGGSDTVYPGQENVIVPSLGVASYADRPEMSSREITKAIVAAIQNQTHDCIIANYANVDMVGHTGDLRATQLAAGHIDSALKAVVSAAVRAGGTALITADHGNAENMVNWENGHIIKEHSANPVPCIIIGSGYERSQPLAKDITLDTFAVSGVLSDVAPTALSMLGLPIPPGMSARPLI